MKQPIFGVGYNRIRYKKAELGLAAEYGSSHAAANYHSSFVTMLAAGGIIGMAFYGLFLISLMKVSRPTFFYIFFLSIISLGDNSLLHPFMMFFVYRLIVLEMA
jgi:O-antigen ligase